MEDNDLIAERRKLITIEAKNAHILSEQFNRPIIDTAQNKSASCLKYRCIWFWLSI